MSYRTRIVVRFSYLPRACRYENGNVLVRDPKDRADDRTASEFPSRAARSAKLSEGQQIDIGSCRLTVGTSPNQKPGASQALAPFLLENVVREQAES